MRDKIKNYKLYKNWITILSIIFFNLLSHHYGIVSNDFNLFIQRRIYLTFKSKLYDSVDFKATNCISAWNLAAYNNTNSSCFYSNVMIGRLFVDKIVVNKH